MSDRPASSRKPAESAPSHPSAEQSTEFVPFKDRDFRKSRQVKPAPTAPARSNSWPAAADAPATSVAPKPVQPAVESRKQKAPKRQIPAVQVYRQNDVVPPPDMSSLNEELNAISAVSDTPIDAEILMSAEETETVLQPVEIPQSGTTVEASDARVVGRAIPETDSIPAEEVAASSVADPEEKTTAGSMNQTESAMPLESESPQAGTRVVPVDTSLSELTDVIVEQTAAPVADVDAESAGNGFSKLDLHPGVLQAVTDSGYVHPTEIQAEIIPHVLACRDVLAQSQTGSGKTAAFALPILSLIRTGRDAPRAPQVLVLAPTRELAMQVCDSFSTYGANLSGLNVLSIYGGQSYETQFRQLKRGVQVVVGTPGRVIDHIKRGTLDLSELGCLVLDEADEMLNMGFLDDVKFVLEQTPEQRQVALFSATLPAPIRRIAEEYLDDPARITIKRKTMTADSIRQRALYVPERDKPAVLKRILEAEVTDGVIVFTKTRDATVSVADQLCREGLAAVALNGDMPQKVRERTIEQLKNGRLDILVATDVAARGLDVTRVSHVINYDVPQDNESYIHRVGRTGRAGRAGEAIIFLKNNQRGRLRQIERATRQTIEIIQPPSSDDINAARAKRFVQQIADTIAKEDLSIFEGLIGEYAEESGTPMASIAAALAHVAQQGRPFLVEDLPQRRQNRRDEFRSEDRGDRRDRGRRNDGGVMPVEAGMERFRISVGFKDGVKPGNIVGAVANEGGIDGGAIGAIKIYSSWSTIDLPEGMPESVRQALQSTTVAGRELRLRPYTDEPLPPEQRGGRFREKPRGGKAFGSKKFNRGSGGPGGKRKFGRKPGGPGGKRPHSGKRRND